jgi:hypothetical protein
LHNKDISNFINFFKLFFLFLILFLDFCEFLDGFGFFELELEFFLAELHGGLFVGLELLAKGEDCLGVDLEFVCEGLGLDG